MPNAFELSSVAAKSSLPLFIPSFLAWGFGLVIASILFSILTWRSMKGLFVPDYRIRALILWIINAGLLITGLIFITRAFPRVSPALVLGILLLLVLGIAGGGAVAVKKETDKPGGKGEQGEKK